MKSKIFRVTAAILMAVLTLTACSSKQEKASVAVSESVETYEGAVSYLGPEGTYTQEATRQFFGTEGDYRPQKTVADAVQQLLGGNCEYAVIPQENTIGGPVYDYVDELLSHENLSIKGEIELPIRQALLGAQGTELQNIKIVYSHKQGITQCKDWLQKNLPNAEVVEVSSTAEGAKMVSESDTGDCAAIASTGAAEVYGLSVLAENIQQNEDNKTRFYVLSTKEAGTGKSDRMVFSAAGEAGDLPKLLATVTKNDLQIVSIHDRPEKTSLGRYVYLIECENGSYNEYEKISSLPEFEFHYFGTFPVR